jgi:hypothetical protein
MPVDLTAFVFEMPYLEAYSLQFISLPLVLVQRFNVQLFQLLFQVIECFATW